MNSPELKENSCFFIFRSDSKCACRCGLRKIKEKLYKIISILKWLLPILL